MSAPGPLAWTRVAPDAAGWYWFRGSVLGLYYGGAPGVPVVVRVSALGKVSVNGMRDSVRRIDVLGEWAGPLAPPPEGAPVMTEAHWRLLLAKFMAYLMDVEGSDFVGGANGHYFGYPGDMTFTPDEWAILCRASEDGRSLPRPTREGAP